MPEDYGTEMADTGMEDNAPGGGDDQGYDGELCISPGDLPAGMKPKAGDVLPFQVTSFGEDGDIYLKFAGKGGAEQDTGPAWEDDFRKEMSPRNNTEMPSTGGESEMM